MSIQVICSNCQSSYQVDESHAGKQGKCKKCGNIIIVPAIENGNVVSDQDDLGEWFITYRGHKTGPIPLNVLQEAYLNGQIMQDTLVWKEGLPSWLAISEIMGQKIAIQHKGFQQKSDNYDTSTNMERQIMPKIPPYIPTMTSSTDQHFSTTSRANATSKQYTPITLKSFLLVAIVMPLIVGLVVAFILEPKMLGQLQEKILGLTSSSVETANRQNTKAIDRDSVNISRKTVAQVTKLACSNFEKKYVNTISNNNTNDGRLALYKYYNIGYSVASMNSDLAMLFEVNAGAYIVNYHAGKRPDDAIELTVTIHKGTGVKGVCAEEITLKATFTTTDNNYTPINYEELSISSY